MTDAIVIGAGLFGSVIAAQLRSQGRSVTIIDNQEPAAGSRPAACLMKPSWFSSMGADVTRPSLELLDRLYGVHDIKFSVGKVAPVTVHWCNPAKILSEKFVNGTVYSIVNDNVYYRPAGGSGLCEISAPLIVVAAGIWSTTLVPIEGGLKGQAGMALLFTEQAVDKPFIQPWAPYRQLVAFNRGDGLWVGDGSAINHENWTKQREQDILYRCQKATANVGHPEKGMKKLFGIRPYTKEKPCYLKELYSGLWVATGGAKNGTISAGWCAHEISRRTA